MRSINFTGKDIRNVPVTNKRYSLVVLPSSLLCLCKYWTQTHKPICYVGGGVVVAASRTVTQTHNSLARDHLPLFTSLTFTYPVYFRGSPPPNTTTRGNDGDVYCAMREWTLLTWQVIFFFNLENPYFLLDFSIFFFF